MTASAHLIQVKNAAEMFSTLESGATAAFISSASTMQYWIDNKGHCDATLVGSSMANLNYGLAFRKGWPHMAEINFAMQTLQESGYISSLYATWFQKSVCPIASNDASSMGLNEFTGVFALLGFCACLAVGMWVAKAAIIAVVIARRSGPPGCRNVTMRAARLCARRATTCGADIDDNDEHGEACAAVSQHSPTTTYDLGPGGARAAGGRTAAPPPPLSMRVMLARRLRRASMAVASMVLDDVDALREEGPQRGGPAGMHRSGSGRSAVAVRRGTNHHLSETQVDAGVEMTSNPIVARRV